MKANKKNNTNSTTNNNNNILLALMFIIIIGLLIYIIFFTGKGGTSHFYEDAIELQKDLSYYIGSVHAEMFGVYEVENILTGTNEEGTPIQNIHEEALVSLVDQDSVQEKDSSRYYKLNAENVKNVLKIELPTYDGIEWYISQQGALKVKFSGVTPKWWNNGLDHLKI